MLEYLKWLKEINNGDENIRVVTKIENEIKSYNTNFEKQRCFILTILFCSKMV